jgi:hypothetical protein
MRGTQGYDSGILAAGVERAIKKIVKAIGYIEAFPQEGGADRERVIGLIERHTQQLSSKKRAFILTELENNWSQYRDNGVTSYMESYPSQRTPGNRRNQPIHPAFL